ncbi:MAG: hypothetical protein ACRDPJ_00385 [Nocardioidaceae bacterium]
MTGCSIADFFGLADQLPEVNGGRYWRIAVGDKTFGCLWEIDELAGAHLRGVEADRPRSADRPTRRPATPLTEPVTERTERQCEQIGTA